MKVRRHDKEYGLQKGATRIMEKEAAIKINESGVVFLNPRARDHIKEKGRIVVILEEEGRMFIRVVSGVRSATLVLPSEDSYSTRFACKMLAEVLGTGKFKVKWDEERGALEVGGKYE